MPKPDTAKAEMRERLEEINRVAIESKTELGEWVKKRIDVVIAALEGL